MFSKELNRFFIAIIGCLVLFGVAIGALVVWIA